MFVDLAGSTELSARLDPEDMSEVIRAYHDSCAETVGRWGGHVAKYMGDGVLAYFGWPTAHEDDAERAVRAGLSIVAGQHIEQGPTVTAYPVAGKPDIFRANSVQPKDVPVVITHCREIARRIAYVIVFHQQDALDIRIFTNTYFKKFLRFILQEQRLK